MTRRLVLLCSACCLAAGLARADELPTRKAGLWEMKVVKVGSAMPELSMQHCTDPTTDKDMINSVSPLAKQMCTKQEVHKTATGYVTDSVCTMAGVSMTSHSELSGDFDAAYSVTTQSHLDKGPESLRDTTTKIEAKYLGDCKPGQKPGDIIMPGGGFRLNIHDAEKLKNLLPSSSPSPSPSATAPPPPPAKK
jgi:hypothetical protein